MVFLDIEFPKYCYYSMNNQYFDSSAFGYHRSTIVPSFSLSFSLSLSDFPYNYNAVWICVVRGVWVENRRSLPSLIHCKRMLELYHANNNNDEQTYWENTDIHNNKHIYTETNTQRILMGREMNNRWSKIHSRLNMSSHQASQSLTSLFIQIPRTPIDAHISVGLRYGRTPGQEALWGPQL